MIYKFTDWMENKQINEAKLYSQGSIPNPFLYLQQSKGDFVYFGIHDLMRYFKENNRVPRYLEPSQIMNKLGQIVDADPVRKTVIVKTNKDPYSYGYKNIESKLERDKRKENPSNGIKINVNDIMHDITSMVPQLAFQERKLWLVIDNNTRSQPAFFQKLAEVEQQGRENVSSQPTQQQIDAAKKRLLAGNPSENGPKKYTAQDLFGKDAVRAPMDTIDRNLHNLKLDLAHVLWKEQNNDSRTYPYYFDLMD